MTSPIYTIPGTAINIDMGPDTDRIRHEVGGGGRVLNATELFGFAIPRAQNQKARAVRIGESLVCVLHLHAPDHRNRSLTNTPVALELPHGHNQNTGIR